MSLDRQVQSVIRLCWLKLYPSPRTNKNHRSWREFLFCSLIFCLLLLLMLSLIILPAFDYWFQWWPVCMNTGGCWLADVCINESKGGIPAVFGARAFQTRQSHGFWIDWPLTRQQKWRECILYSIQIHVFVFVMVSLAAWMVVRTMWSGTTTRS